MSIGRNSFLFSFTTILSGALLTIACDESKSGGTDDAIEIVKIAEVVDAELEIDAPREACLTIGAARDCMNGEGTQFCAGIDGEIAWGDCLGDFACMPGASDDCVLVGGVPQLKQDVESATADEEASSEIVDIDVENSDPLMHKQCYGGSGWWCCDTSGCWQHHGCPDDCCYGTETVCEIP